MKNKKTKNDDNLERLRKEAVRAAKGDEPSTAALIDASNRHIFKLLRKGADDERRGLFMLLGRVGARGKRVAEQALANDGFTDDVVLELLGFLHQRQEDHPLPRAFAGVTEALDGDDVTGAITALDSLTSALAITWARTEGRRRLTTTSGQALLEQDENARTLLLATLDKETDGETLAALSKLADRTCDRHLSKALKTTFFRLRQAGLTIAEQPQAKESTVSASDELPGEAFLSAIDPTGDQAVWIMEEQAEGGHSMLQAIVDEAGSISSARALVVVRRGREKLLESLSGERAVPVVSIPIPAAIGILEAAYAANPAIVSKDYLGWRQMSRADRRGKRPEAVTIPETDRGRLVEASTELYEHAACRHWLLLRSDAEKAERLLTENESSLVLPEHEEARRKTDKLNEVAGVVFTSRLRHRLRRRLEATALFFASSEEGRLALIAQASAEALAADAPELPLLGAMLSRSVEALVEERERESKAKETT